MAEDYHLAGFLGPPSFRAAPSGNAVHDAHDTRYRGSLAAGIRKSPRLAFGGSLPQRRQALFGGVRQARRVAQGGHYVTGKAADVLTRAAEIDDHIFDPA